MFFILFKCFYIHSKVKTKMCNLRWKEILRFYMDIRGLSTVKQRRKDWTFVVQEKPINFVNEDDVVRDES